MSVRVAAILALLASAARAQPREPEMGPEARDHFQRGAALAEQRSYEAASREFEASYQLDPRKESLFAWAQVERLRGNCPKAITLYKKFLDGGGLSDKQKEAALRNVESCERVLEEARAGQPPAPVEAKAPPPVIITRAAPPAPSRRLGLLGGLLVGGAVAALGTAGTFYFLSREDERKASDSSILHEFRDALVRVQNKQRIAIVAGGAGVLLAGGALLHWLAPWADDPAAEVFIAPGGGGLAFGGRFR